MKCFFVLNEHGLDRYLGLLITAIHTLNVNTTLEPYLIFDGSASSIDLIRSNLSSNVKIIPHTFLHKNLLPQDNPLNGYQKKIAEGAYLKIDIATLDFLQDEYFMYADCDIYFNNDPKFPRFDTPIAAVNELWFFENSYKISQSIFNSGMMVINRSEFLKKYNSLIDLCIKNDFYFNGDGGFYDQGALNKVFLNSWTHLPQEFNYRIYSGLIKDLSEAVVIHLHGPKVIDIQNYLSDRQDLIHQNILELLENNTDGYFDFLKMLNS